MPTSLMLFLRKPLVIKNDQYANTKPDAPTTTPEELINQVNAPENRTKATVRVAKRAGANALTRQPIIKSGTILANKCLRLACKNGDTKIPGKPLIERGRIPSQVRLPGNMTSIRKTATIAALRRTGRAIIFFI
ncbi:hypothetical protein NBRC116583_19980 [Arenicella sp. 4NH20-0111]